MSGASPSRRRACLLVLALTALAVGLRWRGIDFMLPHYAQTDGRVFVSKLLRLRAGLPDPPRYGHSIPAYGNLVPQLASLIPDRSEPGSRVPRSLDEHARRFSSTWIDLRAVSILLSALIVPLTYSLARRFLSRPGALVAAAVPATSLVHVSLSQMERPHGTAATMALLAVVAALRLRRRPTPMAHVSAGLACGLAIGTLQSGVACLLPLAAAWLLRRRDRSAARGWLLATALGLVACVRWLYPFPFERAPSLGAAADERVRLGGHGLRWEQFDGSGLGRLLATFLTYDPFVLAVLLLGGGWLLATRRRRPALEAGVRRDLLVVLAYALPYASVLAVFAGTYERFTLQLLPFAGLLAGRVFDLLPAASEDSPRSGARRLARPLFAACLLLPLASAWKLGSVRAARDTQAAVADWLLAHASESDRIDLLPYVDLPVLFGPRSLAFNLSRSTHTRWVDYQGELEPLEFKGTRLEVHRPARLGQASASLEDPLEHYRRRGTRWLVLQQVGPRFQFEQLLDLRRELRAEGPPAARFSPLVVDSGEAGNMDTRYQRPALALPFFVHLWRCDRMGPTLEIYDLSTRPAGR